MQASKETKENFKRLGKRIEKILKFERNRDTRQKEGKTYKVWKTATPDLAFDLENETTPSIIYISSNTTENESPKTAQNVEVTNEEKVKEEIVPKASNCPEKATIPVKVTAPWQIEKRGPFRTSERRHIPPKQHGIDLITKEQEGQEIEEK